MMMAVWLADFNKELMAAMSVATARIFQKMVHILFKGLNPDRQVLLRADDYIEVPRHALIHNKTQFLTPPDTTKTSMAICALR